MSSGNVISFLERARLAALATADRAEKEQAIERKRDDFAKRRERIATIGMPDEDRQLVISNTLNERDFKTLRAARVWWSRPQPTLVLGGSTGRGKTLACADIIATHGGEFIEAPDLGLVWARRTAPDRARCEKLKQALVLVIDDVGTEPALDRAVLSLALVQLINARSTRRARTMLTFNGDAERFHKVYPDERLLSRMGSRHCAWLVDNGPDMRLAHRGGGR